ncbi:MULTISPECIES: sigma-70 family RNA polymerase sigma factor [unclassified Dehalobacter]|jgi:RNA polymerase sigma factor, sigma-70 family|uniref:sigma-70 family RNA polymerase sigma factor n=1 Tax=unclassified Dehalobacter TaxID=2635733 RepID=UPI00028BC03C|nr:MULTISPECIES: sigma-70 family RNA polymerase sigma factor [unclassified Dehalobacter]AFV01149.1 RNA polymerase sigma factor SigZ [Dehalobacter sp. DCA]AFV04192.1 RNA polymerase sigma factor SigZ [Dehalobacter sp. CF]
MAPEELWIIYSPKLKNYIMKQVSDQYEAEDILQEVGLRIQKSASKIQEITNVEAWLYRIAHNLIVDYYRSARKYALTEDIGDIADIANLAERDATGRENYNNETAECLLKLVEYLPITDQEAILECDYKGTKQNLLAEKWGISKSGSKSRIQRARKRLTAVLQSCCEVKKDHAGNIIEFNNKDHTGTEFSCLKC